MKRIKITAICMSLLATLSMVGCVCPPAGYYSGMHRGYAPNHIPCDSGCDPCGPPEMGCGVIEYTGTPCAPQSCAPQPYMPPTCIPKVVDCRTTFSHLGNGVLLIGRGIIDITAAPFVILGNALSSNCRYEVLTRHDNVVCYTVPQYQMLEPCAPSCTSGCTGGCDTCAGGYTDGIQFGTSTQTRTMLPAPAHRTNSVTQASYQEPTAPVMRFVQPK